jgi:hypothetical protein
MLEWRAMPVLREDMVLGIARGIKAFLSLRAGLTRGEVPDLETLEERLKVRARKLSRAQGHVKEARKLLSSKDEEIAKLQAQLERTPSLPNLPGVSTPLFFLVGHGRSGTTWLQTILNSHPEILCMGEGWLFNRDFRREDFKELHPRLKPSSLYNALAHSEYLRLWIERSVWAAGEEADEHLDNLTGLAVGYFLTNKLSKAGKRIVGDKTASPGAEVFEEIARILPEAKVIHIIRDGRDVSVSVMHFMWNYAITGSGIENVGGIYELEPEELERREAYRRDPSAALRLGGIFTEKRLRAIARGWREEVGEAIERGPKALGKRYAEVRYEDLLERPEEEVGRLLAMLGTDASEGAARACVEATGFERLSARERGQEDSTSVRFRKGVAGDWRNAFSEEDKRVFKEEAGELLIELGYEEDYDW